MENFLQQSAHYSTLVTFTRFILQKKIYYQIRDRPVEFQDLPTSEMVSILCDTFDGDSIDIRLKGIPQDLLSDALISKTILQPTSLKVLSTFSLKKLQAAIDQTPDAVFVKFDSRFGFASLQDLQMITAEFLKTQILRKVTQRNTFVDDPWYSNSQAWSIQFSNLLI